MPPKKGRRPLVEDEHFKATVVAAKSDLVDRGQLAGYSSAVWNVVSQKLGLKDDLPLMDARAVYTAVRANRCGILTLLGLAKDGSVADKPDTVSVDDVSSSSADESSVAQGSSYHETSSGTDDGQPSIKFALTIPASEWDGIRPKLHVDKRTETDRPKLKTRTRMRMPQNVWGPKFSAAVYLSHRLPCTWSFEKAQVIPGSDLRYVSITGHCTDLQCRIVAVLPKAPKPKSDAVFSVKVTGRFGEKHSGTKKRQLKGKDRELLVEKMVEANIPACEVRRMEAAAIMEMGDPVPPHIPTAGVLRVAKCRRLKSSRGHDDPFTAVSLLKFTSGYSTTIQTLSWFPFSLHYWTIDQLRMYSRYAKRCKSSQSLSKVFIDATGGIVRKLARPDGSRSGSIFLYQVVIRTGGQQFPVCQMLTESHNAVSIAFWLQEWVRLGAPKPRMAVSDFSLALLYGMVRSFTGCADVKDYIRRCFGAIKGEGEPPECLIRLDIAHFMKMVRSSEPMKKMSRLVREFYLRAVGLLVRSDNIDAAKAYLGAIFMVALSETTLTESVQVGPVDAVKKFLQNQIAAVDLSVVGEVTTEYDFSDVTEFESWAEELRDEVVADLRDGGGDPNAFHSPDFVKYLVRLCKSFPLWSALMDKRCGQIDGSVASSASVESEYNDLKTRVFAHGVTLPARLDDFFKHHVGSIEGKILLASSALDTADEGAIDEEQPTVTAGNSEMVCPACAVGKLPPEDGAHQCYECGSPIHPFDGCSFLVGLEDEHPQKRVCRSCHTKPNDRSDHLYSQMQGPESDTCEDWRGLGIGELQSKEQKKRRHSYAFPNPEFGYKDLSDTKRVSAAFPVLQNGHLVRLEPKIVGSVPVSLSNTCAFDSVVHAVAAAVKLSAVYADEIIGYVCPLTHMGFQLAQGESKMVLYRERTELIYKKYSKDTSRVKTLVDGTISINCETTVPALLNDMIIVRSAMSNSVCDDPGKLCPWKDQSVSLQVVTIPAALITRAQFENFDVNQIVPGPSICHQPFSLNFGPEALSDFTKSPASYMTVDPAYDNGRPVCNGIRTHELKFQSPHIFIEVEQTGGHISGDIVVPTKVCRLDSIPERLVIGEKIFGLRAVIECDAPTTRGTPKLCSMSHYKTFSPLGGDNWICFDDSIQKSKTVSAGMTVSCQVLMYTV